MPVSEFSEICDIRGCGRSLSVAYTHAPIRGSLAHRALFPDKNALADHLFGFIDDNPASKKTVQRSR
jgi:hypothetical protein